ncbi:MAG: beta-lactamase family protein [Acidimicrobiales bacterium]|nr:beta-lactamase family protein [Acidimicrobiales bacterium]
MVGQPGPIAGTDHLRMASVAKAYSGAVALSLVADKVLSLKDTVHRWLPSLPKAWGKVTLAQLLQHTSGISDFSKNPDFHAAVMAAPLDPPSPPALLDYAAPKLSFTPGTRYRYSNSDNVVVALMVQAATGRSYEDELAQRVLTPLGLDQTSLPRGVDVPAPVAPGYGLDPPRPPTDVTDAFAAGWSWASGGVVATPLDANAFIRGYARGATTNRAGRAAQFQFRAGTSEPPGPGTNAAGLAIFRYKTACGTVYGHTGNTAGYTQFVAASADGTRSVVVSINAQITPTINGSAFPALQHIYELGVCTALDG